MTSFAYVEYPARSYHLISRFPRAGILPSRWIEGFLPLLPPFSLGEIAVPPGLAGRSVRGWLLACPGNGASRLPGKIDSVLNLAGRLGASAVGLEGPSGQLGRRGEERGLHLSTGDLIRAAGMLNLGLTRLERGGLDRSSASVVIEGADTDLGEALAWILAPQAGQLTLIGRRRARVEALAGRILRSTGIATRWAGSLPAPEAHVTFLTDPDRHQGPGILGLALDLVALEREVPLDNIAGPVIDRVCIGMSGYLEGLGGPGMSSPVSPALVEVLLVSAGFLPPIGKTTPQKEAIRRGAALLEELRLEVIEPPGQAPRRQARLA